MNWEKLLENLYGALIKEDRWKLYLQGLAVTLQIAAIACAIGIVLGLLVAVVKIYAANTKKPNRGGAAAAGYGILRVLNTVCNFYTTVIRGTPVVVQLLILYSFSFMPNGLVASIIGFGINSGAYVSEIFRGGINSVDSGQMEAGRSLGLSQNKTMWYVVLPQAIKNILPSLFNEFISLVKETSIAGYIAVNDLTKMANGIKGRTFNPLPFFVAAILYLLLTLGLTQVQQKIERRLARSD
ncbi:MAG: amino acid ABC transporter permease [Oscillospiraceae bacterium]